jgi:hypothetical protein
MGRGLQPPSVVERWTEAELLSFIESRNILNDKNRATFSNADISGRGFLRDGDVRDFWLHQCCLPIGPSGELAELAQTIKNMGNEKSRGNAFHLGSDQPANTFAVESSQQPTQLNSLAERLEFSTNNYGGGSNAEATKLYAR